MLNSGLENLSPVLTWQNAGKNRLVSNTPRPTKHPRVVRRQPGSCVRPPSLCHRCRSYVVGRVERVSPRLQGRLRTLLEKNASVRQIVGSYKGEGPFQEGAGGPGPSGGAPGVLEGSGPPSAPLPIGGSGGSQAQSSSIQPLARRLFLIPAPFFPFLLRISASLQAILTRDNLERLLATGNPPGACGGGEE
ncbi:hypothetical protein E2320_023063 [Naja naja]|nr:hypothetical protein E2320_023063 [Naja naja]